MASEKKFICIVTDHVEPDLHWEEGRFKRGGADYRHYQMRLGSAEQILKKASEADVLIVDQAKITAEVIRGLRRCRLIIRHGDGYDNLDLNAATEAGIICINEPGFWSREVAEQAFVLGLSLALKLPIQESVARSARTDSAVGWNLQKVMPYSRLQSLTVGILGFGKIGATAAGLYGGVVDRVFVYDPYMDSKQIESAGGIPVSLDRLIAESDIISLHTPATDKTVGLVDSRFIGKMKRGSILVNTSRGAVVETDAAVAALKSGQLGGAGLDSTDPEPLPGDHPLFDMDNVIITPHMGWYSEDALQAMREQIAVDALGAADGRVPDSVVNPEVLKRDNLRLR
jgi:D-3-phosphoglycerate dehydrogenase